MNLAGEADAIDYCREQAGRNRFEVLQRLVELLCEENERQNLFAKVSAGEIWRRHIADSLQLLDHVPRGTGCWLDLGSGGGFPGLVVAAAAPERQTVLVEPRKLRVEWLHRAAERLSLPNVSVESVRVEALASRPAAVISARAMAPLPKLLTLSARFSTPDTVWVLPKGRSAGHELSEQPLEVRAMFHVEPSITDHEAGILVGRGVPNLR